jgi:hypothetical protein
VGRPTVAIQGRHRRGARFGEDLVAHRNTQGHNAHHLRLVLVLLLWCTGMRIGEALELRRQYTHLLADS